MAEALAARGCRLALVDIDAAAADETARSCGGAAVVVQDLTAPDGPQAAVAEAIAALGGLEIVVNNAGYGVAESFFEMRAATWDRTLDLNLRAVALITRRAPRGLRSRDRREQGREWLAG